IWHFSKLVSLSLILTDGPASATAIRADTTNSIISSLIFRSERLRSPVWKIQTGNHMIALPPSTPIYAVAALNAALDNASETQFRVREETLLALLSKLEQRVLSQKPTDRAPITCDQVDTVSFLTYMNRHAMRQCGV